MIIQCAEDLIELCSSATPEGLHLEYKRKADPMTPRLDKYDKRSIAEAIVSFANSDGGILIYGIESKMIDGLDVAHSLGSIAEIDKFVGEMRLVAELNVSPQVRGLVIEAIPKGDGSGAGFAVCRVPSSEHRPHMSTAPDVHRYYRRSFTGSSLMTPSEIRDQILATREASLEPIIRAGGGSVFTAGAGWAGMKSGFQFKLRNIGNRLCREPFLRVAPSCNLTSYSSLFDSRLSAWKTDHPTGTLIHVGDEINSISLDYIARMDVDSLLNYERLTVKAILESVAILPGGDVFTDATFLGDSLDSIQLSLTFGAENATARTEIIIFTREELAQRILATCAEALRATLKIPVAEWRQDLFDQIGRFEQQS
jgi:Putative DNA-binding domain